MAGKKNKVVYQEFGQLHSAATQRAVRDLPPQQQDLRVQASRKGRKGKTVTEVRGFQHSPETLKGILKKLKSQCGTGGTAKEDTLEIQGDHREKLVELLAQMGYQVKISGG
jgi:translation initiation factor 1